MEPISANKDTIGKSISRGAEWRKIQLHSTFQLGVMMKTGTSLLAKHLTIIIVHGFRPKTDGADFGKQGYHRERASQEEQNGAKFSFIAPSSEE